jgi:hypothetical protein
MNDVFVLCDEMICRRDYVRELAVQIYGDVVERALGRIPEVAVDVLMPPIIYFVM